MPSPPTLDVAKLLAPIPGSKPAGEPRAYYELKDKIEEARKEVDPNNFPPNDPRRPKEPKKADWPGIIRMTAQVLTSTSKDLRVAAWLVEALLKEYGYAGLRDGLLLLQKLVEDCWDRLNPPIEDNDLEVRAAPFILLDVADRGARFPHSLRTVPIFFYEGKRYSLLDAKTSLEGKGPIPKADVEKVIQATPVGTYRQALEDLEKSRENLTGLVQALQKRMEKQAPGMTGLRPVVEEVFSFLKEITARVSPPAQTNGQTGEQPAPPPTGTAGAAPVVPVTAKATRAEIYRQLTQAANALKELEPHSPIPYFIQRAVDLGKLAFPELIKALVREEKILKDLNRELGIEEEKPKK